MTELRGMIIANKYAGHLHDYVFKYGAVITLVLGGQSVYSKLTIDRYDRSALIILCLLLFYAVLTGHRFAALNKFTAFYLLPFCLVFAYKFHFEKQNIRKCASKDGWIIIGIVIVVFSISLFAIINSYSNVRTTANESVIARIQERLLIQQGELWVEEVNRIKESGKQSIEIAMNNLFFDPIVPGKNTSIQYLMWLSLGNEAEIILNDGRQFAGGFPEIFVEIFGIYILLPILMLYGMIMAMVFVVFLVSLRKGKLLSMLMTSFIIYGFMLTVYNGMLNQFFILTFWIKIIILTIVFVCKPIQIPKLILYRRLGKVQLKVVFDRHRKKDGVSG